MDNLHTVGFWLIKKLCLDTNAEKATFTIDGFHDKEGNQLGDWEITVKKKDK